MQENGRESAKNWTNKKRKKKKKKKKNRSEQGLSVMSEDPWTLIPGADCVSVSVTVVEAVELNGPDPSKIDAFARVWVGKRKMKQSTRVFQNSSSPAWNEHLEFAPVPQRDPEYRWLLVEVFDAAAGPSRAIWAFFVLTWPLSSRDRLLSRAGSL